MTDYRDLEATGGLSDAGSLALASGALSDARVTIRLGLDEEARERLEMAISDLDQARDPLAAHARQYLAAVDGEMTPQKRADVIEAIGATIAGVEARIEKEPSGSYAQGVSDAYNANATNAQRAADRTPSASTDPALAEAHRVAAANFPATSPSAGRPGVQARPQPRGADRGPGTDFAR